MKGGCGCSYVKQGCGHKKNWDEDYDDYEEQGLKINTLSSKFCLSDDEALVYLFRSILSPERFDGEGIKFPSASDFSMKTHVYQSRNTFTLKTNASGNCLVQFNLGQFLDDSQFVTGINGVGVAGANALGYFNAGANQNGTSTVGNSNVFVCNDASLTGVVPVSNNGTVMQAVSTLGVQNGYFNSLRQGPMSVRYEYIGRMDICSGDVLMGIAYTHVNDPVNVATSVPGLYPDVTYSSSAALENTSHALRKPITDRLRAIYVPHDSNCLNMRSPTDAKEITMGQKLYIFINGAPPNANVARISVNVNWEGIPSTSLAEITRPTNSFYPGNFNGREVYDYIISNNLVVSNELSDAQINSIITNFKKQSGKYKY